MTTETIATGWLMVGAALALAGVGVIWFARSEWAERRAERVHQADVERRLAAIPLGLAQTVWEQHVADAIRATERAAVTPLPGVRLRAVPTQRDGSAS